MDNETSLFDKTTQYDTLEDRLLSLAKEFREAESEKKRRRDSQGQRVLWAMLGKTLVDENELGLPEEIEQADGEIYITVPIFGSMGRNIKKEVVKSNPAYGFLAENGDMDEAQVARYGTTFADKYVGEFFTHRFEQCDVESALAFGFSCYALEWDPTKGIDYDHILTEDVMEEFDPELMRCPKCDTEAAGDGVAEAPCPKCGEAMIKLPGNNATVEREVGREKRKAGDLCFKRIDPFCVNANSFYGETLDDCMWMAVDEVVDKAIFRKWFGEIELPNGSILNDTYLHLRRKRSYARAQSGLETSYNLARAPHEMLSSREVIVSRDYVAPEVYESWDCACEIYEDKYATEPIKVEAGTKLITVAPKGICIAHTNFGKAHRIYAEDWRFTHLITQHSTKDGDIWGTTPAPQALELQYNIDELLSQATTAAYEMGAPTYFYDEGLIPEGMGAGGSASLKIPMRRRSGETGNPVVIVPPAGVSEQIFVLVDMYKKDMQAILGSWSPFGGGLPDAAGNTATGMSIATSQAESQQAMFLSLRAEAKAEILRRAMVLFNKHADVERAFRLGGPYSGGAILLMRKGFLPDDTKLFVKKNSYWPRELFQQQNLKNQYLQTLMMAHQVAQLRQEPLTLAEERGYAADFCQDIATNRAEIASELASDQIKKAEDIFKRYDAKLLSGHENDVIDLMRLKMAEEAMQDAQLENEASQQLDPETGELVSVGPPAEPEMPMDLDVLIRAMNEEFIPIREGLDPHKYLVAYYQEWAMTWKGRQADMRMQKWLDERTKQSEELAQQQAAKFQSLNGGTPPGGGGPMDQQAMLMAQMQQQGGGMGVPPSSVMPTGAPPSPQLHTPGLG